MSWSAQPCHTIALPPRSRNAVRSGLSVPMTLPNCSTDCIRKMQNVALGRATNCGGRCEPDLERYGVGPAASSCQRPVEGYSSTEEGAVTLVSDLGEMALKWIGREAEPGLDRRPRERSRVANELAGKIRRGVPELDACVDAAPIDIERNHRLNGGTIEERVADISVVLDLEVGDMDGGRPAAEVHFHASAVDRYSPEQAALFGAGIEVVNLGRQTDVREDVQSDEGECALPVAAIEADVLAVHEANVRLPEQPAVGLVLAGTRSPLADSDEPIEIGDQRRIASTALDRVRGADRVCCGEVEVKETERAELRPAR